MIVDDQPELIGRWVCERTGGKWHGDGQAIGLMRKGQLVAGVLFDGYNGANVNMHVASDGSRAWLNREFLWFCFYYPFCQMGVKRVTGLVSSANANSRRFCEHLGFELEATLKQAHPQGDLMIYVMTPDKCRWLGLKGKRHGQS